VKRIGFMVTANPWHYRLRVLKVNAGEGMITAWGVIYFASKGGDRTAQIL